MTADTLKTTRVLELYQDFLSGKLINKQQAAEQYHVNVRSIQRDIDSIRDFLSEQCAKEGIVRKIEYDKKENGYRLVTQEIEQLSKGEVLALCKILLESRAFTKEQVEKQLQIILNLCVSQKEKADIEWFIGNELFNYHDPAHAAVDPDNLWMVAQAVRNQLVLEIEYQILFSYQFSTNLTLVLIIGIPGKTCELHARHIVKCASEGLAVGADDLLGFSGFLCFKADTLLATNLLAV